DSEGKIVEKIRRETPIEVGAALTSIIGEMANELKSKYEVYGIVVCSAGFFAPDRRSIIANPNIANWNGVELAQDLEALIGRPVVLENDANAAAWGERQFGAGDSANELVMLTIGTGLGGGLITDGKIFRGSRGSAAEFGHMRAVPEGHLCGCGLRGCYEQYASGTALMRHAREAISASPELSRSLLARGNGTVDGLTGEHLTSAAKDGDPVAIAAFNTTGHWIGALVATLEAALDPAKIVIGGGVIAAGEILLDPIRESMAQLSLFRGRRAAPEIVAATLGNDAGLIGVANLTKH
ncbi:MAG: ROK family protein, partial [Candidatus Nanopelagicaceae bacterium]